MRHDGANRRKERSNDADPSCNPWTDRRGTCRACPAPPGAGRRGLRSDPQRSGVAPPAVARPVPRPARGRYRARLHEPPQRRTPRRHVPLRGLRPAALCLGDEIRQRHRLALLLEAPRQCRGDPRGLGHPRPPDRGALPPLRRPSWSCLQRRPEADRQTLLQERAGADLPAGLILGPDRPIRPRPSSFHKYPGGAGAAPPSFRAPSFRAPSFRAPSLCDPRDGAIIP